MSSGTTETTEAESAPKSKRKRDIKADEVNTESERIPKELKSGSPTKPSTTAHVSNEENVENMDPSVDLHNLSLEDHENTCDVCDEETSVSIFEHLLKSVTGVPISSMRLELRRVLLPVRGDHPQICQKRVVLQLHKIDDQGQSWCYDLDIGFLLNCHKVLREQPGIFRRWGNLQQSAYFLLVLRKDYFGLQRSEKQFSYPDRVFVSGVTYKIHHCAGDDYFCYGVPFHDEFRLVWLDNQPVLHPEHASAPQNSLAAGSSTAPALTYTRTDTAVLLAVRGLPHATLGDKAADAEQKASFGFELPENFSPSAQMLGKKLWPPPYGEVYQGFLLKGCRVGEEVVFDHRGAETVAIKVVRHLNDHFGPQLEPIHRTTDGLQYLPLPIHHHDNPTATTAITTATVNPVIAQASSSPAIPIVPELNTSHLMPFFDAQCAGGKNENMMREIEMMGFLQQSIARMATNPAASATAAALQRRFQPLPSVGLCSNNLYLATKYLPFGSLFIYLEKHGRLDERCCQHVIFQVLYCVHFLHEHGIADQDLSPENLLLQAPTEAKQELLDQCGQRLSQADFLQMEVVMIDRGLVGVHKPKRFCKCDSSNQQSSMSLSTSNISCATVDSTSTACTATTGESSSSRSDAPSIMCGSCASPLPQHRQGGVNTSGTTKPHAHDRFFPRCHPSKKCVGKIFCHCSELSFDAASARKIHAALVAKAVALGLTLEDAAVDGLPTEEELKNMPPVPELEYYCGMCVDMWQIGVMIIYLMTGAPPFDLYPQKAADRLQNQITWFEDLASQKLAARPVEWTDEHGVKERSTLGAKLPADCFDLLKQLLRFDPNQRISAEQALQHRWFHGLNIT